MTHTHASAPSPMTVLIIGGGIAGLATALALQRRGIKARVFERTSQLREVGSGLILAGNAVQVLHQFGLAEVLSSIALPLGSAHLRSWRGEVLVDLPVQQAVQRGEASMVAVHRADLQAALVQALEPGSLRTQMHATEFVQDEQGVLVRFVSGEEVWGDLLVGADGLHSVVRAQLVGASRPRYAGYTAWRAVTCFPLAPCEARAAVESWGAGKRFGIIPLTQGRICWFVVANAPEGAREEESREKQRVLDLVASCHEPARAVVEATEASAILRTDIYDRPPIVSWSLGRVTLAGDAAHPMTPNLGQGACQAIEDALALAESLQRGPTIVGSLQRYEARRIARANTLAHRSWQQGRIAHWEHPWGVRLRDLALRLMPPRLLLKPMTWIMDNQIERWEPGPADPFRNVTPPEGEPSMSTEENKARVRRALEALNSGDLGELAQIFDELFVPGFVRHDTTGGLRSREEYTRVLSGLLSALPGQFTIDDLIAEGEKVVLRYTFHGTHQGPWRGMAPTGKPVMFTGMLIYRFEASKIVEGWENVDVFGLFQQLGGGPAPGQTR